MTNVAVSVTDWSVRTAQARPPASAVGHHTHAGSSGTRGAGAETAAMRTQHAKYAPSRVSQFNLQERCGAGPTAGARSSGS